MVHLSTQVCSHALPKVYSLVRMLGFRYILRSRQPSFSDLLKEKKWTDSGLMIASKFRILGRKSSRHSGLTLLDADDIIFQSASHLDAGASKGVLYALLKVGSENMMVWSSNLSIPA